MQRSIPFADAGTASALFLAAVVLAMHVVQPEVNPATRFVSEYAHGPFGWLVSVAYLGAGLGTLALAWALHAASPGRWAVAAAIGTAVVGLGLVATGATRIDLASADGSIASTASGSIHELAGYVVVLGLIPAGFVLSGAFRREARLASAAGPALLLAWLLVLNFGIAIASQSLDLTGVGQRVFLGSWVAWLIFVGLRLRGVAGT